MVKSVKLTTATIVCAIYCLYIVPPKSVNILVIVPTPSYSHQVAYQRIWTTLSQRGHKVVIITTDPINDPSLTNLTEIDIHSAYPILQKNKFVKTQPNQWLNHLREHLWPISQKLLTMVYEHPEVRKMYAPDSDEKFDAVIIELLFTPGLYYLAHRFNAPLIGVLSLGIQSNQYYMLGAPVLSSHLSCWELEEDIVSNLSFWQRINNFIRIWYHIYCVFTQLFPEQQMLAEKYLGKDIPNISDMERNISIIFHSQEEVISHVRPQMSNVKSFGSLHSSRKLVPLTEKLEKFLMDVPNGFVYVSLGTNIRMSMLPEHVLNFFRNVFANLPCKVLWKMDMKLPNYQPKNVYVANWFPQQTILGKSVQVP